MSGRSNSQGGGGVVVPGLAFVFAIYYLYDVWGERTETMLYGLLVGSLVLALCTLIFASSWWRSRRRSSIRDTLEHGDSRALRAARGNWRGIFIFVALLLYATLQPWIGFTTSTALFLGIALWVLGTRHPLLWLTTTVGLTSAINFAFIHLLKVPLPGGVLF